MAVVVRGRGVPRGDDVIGVITKEHVADSVANRECREFRVRAVIMGRKESQYVPTQRACDTE
jgi:hypothetical protein